MPPLGQKRTLGVFHMYVYVYGIEATYGGNPAFEWSSPKVGDRHNAMLFLAQDVDTPQQQEAEAQLTDFGFIDFILQEGRPVQVERLNNPTMKAFAKHYEGAMTEGSSLVWYPDPL